MCHLKGRRRCSARDFPDVVPTDGQWGKILSRADGATCSQAPGFIVGQRDSCCVGQELIGKRGG